MATSRSGKRRAEPPATVELNDHAFANEVEHISGWTSDELDLLLIENGVPDHWNGIVFRGKKTEEAPNSPEIHFEPIVKLDTVEIKTLEEDEEEIFRMRSKLYRYDSNSDPPEWKERGVGDVKILRHQRFHSRARILMRRDKTLKICANHFITAFMKLQPNCGSERAWVWTTPADFADEEAKAETLAIRFATAENAQKFKEKIDECQQLMAEQQEKKDNEKPESSDAAPDSNGKLVESSVEKSTNEIAEKLGEMTVKEPEATTTPKTDGETESPKKAEDNKNTAETEDSKEESKEDSTKENVD